MKTYGEVEVQLHFGITWRSCVEPRYHKSITEWGTVQTTSTKQVLIEKLTVAELAGKNLSSTETEVSVAYSQDVAIGS
jgi:hypothetical protein